MQSFRFAYNILPTIFIQSHQLRGHEKVVCSSTQNLANDSCWKNCTPDKENLAFKAFRSSVLWSEDHDTGQLRWSSNLSCSRLVVNKAWDWSARCHCFRNQPAWFEVVYGCVCFVGMMVWLLFQVCLPFFFKSTLERCLCWTFYDLLLQGESKVKHQDVACRVLKSHTMIVQSIWPQ